MSEQSEKMEQEASSTTAVPEKPPGPKPSGIRPPSKIGRLCSTTTHKPALPAAAKNDAASEIMRRISEEYSRKPLADVQEADEESDTLQDVGIDSYLYRDRKPSTCSTYSITSMEALWETYPRRLSEAGLRRTSDHSIVLTEDTDGFIIGDRVYVGGNKPGQIAYIGDTQFAPGEWAGVVLDEPIGKNDGSVAGIRYFQCEPKKGVFSRLTRLTREPLSLPSPTSPASERGSITSEKPPLPNGNTRSPSSVVSSIPRSTRQRSTSPNGSMKSFSSRISTTGELKLGERVIMSSSQGSKAGTLRYMGPTEFAAGQWCGVELDDPIGKNDGSVEGKRYFECAPRFGLFAPYAKVSRSPSNRRPTTCAVHGRGSPPDSLASSMLSASGSTRPRLGVTSLGVVGNQRTSGPRAVSTPMSAKNTLQELLREKQQHIQHLMKELDLEKNEIAKMCGRVDAVQTELDLVKKENIKYTEELKTMKEEREKISRQLEDEKQKVDDLIFRSEEDNIHKEDFSKLKENLMEEKEQQKIIIQNLEAELAKINSQFEEIQMQNDFISVQHKAEIDVLTAQHKDELQAGQDLASQLQNLLDEAHTLLREKVAEREVLDKTHFDEMSKIRSDSEKVINELKTKLSETQTELNTYISSSNEKINEAENKITSLTEKLEKGTLDNNTLIRDLRSQLEQKQILLDLSTQESNDIIAASKENELSCKKEYDKLKMQYSSINLDLESAIEEKRTLKLDVEKYQSELNNIKSALSNKEIELNSVITNLSEEHNNTNLEIKRLQEEIHTKQSLLDKMLQEKTEQEKHSLKQLEEYSLASKKNLDEINTLKIQLNSINKELIDEKLLKDELVKKINEKELEIEKVVKQMEQQKIQLDNDYKSKENEYREQIEKAVNELKTISEQNCKLQLDIENLTKKNSEISTTLTSIQTNNTDLERQLKTQKGRNEELEKFKEMLERQISDITSNSLNSDEQLSIISNKLIEAENNIKTMHDDLREKNDEYHNFVMDHEEFKNRTNNEINTLTEQIKTLNKQNDTYKEQLTTIDSQMVEEKEINKKTTLLLSEMETKHNKEKFELIDNIKNEISLKTELSGALEQSNIKIKQLSSQIETLENNANLSENALNKKVTELTTDGENLKKELEESRNKIISQENSYKEILKELNESKNNFETLIHAKNEKETISHNEILKLQENNMGLKKTLDENNVLLKELQQKNSELDLELKSNIDVTLEKDRQLEVVKLEISKLLEEKHTLEKKLNTIISDLEIMQQKNIALDDNIVAKENIISKQLHDLQEINKKICSFTNSFGINNNNKTEIDCVKICEVLDKIFNYKNDYEVLKENSAKVQESYIEEIHNIKIINEELTKKLYESNKLTEELRSQNEKSQEVKELIQVSEATAKNEITKVQTEKKKYEELSQKLQTDLETTQIDYKNYQEASKEELKACQLQLMDSQKELKEAISQQNELNASLKEAEVVAGSLKSKVLELEVSLNESTKNNEQKNQKLVTEMQNLKDTYTLDLEDMKNEIIILKDKIAKKRRDVEKYKNQLQISNEDFEKNKTQNAQMAQEVLILRNKIKELENNNTIQKPIASVTPIISSDQNKPSIDAKKLLEEKEEVEGQVNFLNSVIIDMQKKNEELKARVEILEMGVPIQEAEEFNYIALKQKKVAPRMFCDICDVFDAHETEDCPRQTNDDVEFRTSDVKKKIPAPRPYCDLCEVFGHTTEDCNEEETY